MSQDVRNDQCQDAKVIPEGKESILSDLKDSKYQDAKVVLEEKESVLSDLKDSKYQDAKVIKEGKATILLPPAVFYNPVQEFNRDITIAVISEYSRVHVVKTDVDICVKSDALEVMCNDETAAVDCPAEPIICDSSEDANLSTPDFPGKKAQKLRILEALAASGLRSVRFAMEVPNVTEVVANDYDVTAVDYIRQNVRINNVEHLVTPSCADGAMLMYENRRRAKRFEVVDLDPYGSPTPFLDAAVQSVIDGGLLCVTCTDMAVLCGNATETCHAKYGSTSLHSKFCHEMALRILLRSIESHANRYSRFIAPLLCISVDFYCRVFVRVFTGQHKVKDSATKLSNVYQCNGCSAFALQPLVIKTPSAKGASIYTVSTGPPVATRCPHCNGRYNLGGPIWSAPIHDLEFVRRLIGSVDCEEGKAKFNTCSRIVGVLSVVCEELPDVPLYYDMDDLCRIIHCTAVGFLPLRSAVLNAGYAVSLAHASKKSLKTNAPAEVIWDIMRCWVRTHPVKDDRLRDGSTAKNLLSKPPSIEADFTIHPDANPASRMKGLVRWQLNPESDWGPKPRPSRATAPAEGGQIKEKGRGRTSKRKAEKMLEDQLNFKSFACRRFQRGLCNMGSECRYSHDISDSADIAGQDSKAAVQTLDTSVS